MLSIATRQERVLLTFNNEDFGELVFRDKQKAPFGVILFRVLQDAPDRIQTIVEALESRTDWVGHFSVVDTNNIRRHPLPD